MGLYLNSILLPVPNHAAFARRHVQFAHRAFQEFLLAYQLVETRADPTAYPHEIRDWCAAIAEMQA